MADEGVSNMEWWVLLPVAAGFAALIWFLVWLSKKYPKTSMDTWIPVVKAISDGVGYVIKAFDKDPKTESNTERIYRYASIAVASVEQAWKKIREKMEEGENESLHETMKEEAMSFVDKLAEADNMTLTPAERGIIDGIVEAALYFLPKPAKAEAIKPEGTD